MKVGDNIKYTARRGDDGAMPQRDGQVARVIRIWKRSRRVAGCATLMVRFTDGYEFPVCKNECKIVAPAETAVKTVKQGGRPK